MSSIEAFVILAMAAFYFSIVPWSKWTDQFMLYAMLLKPHLKNGRFIRSAVRAKTLGEFLTVICLNTFNRTWKGLDQVL